MPNVRSDYVAECVTQVVEGMGEMGLSPQEGAIAAEMIIWTLFENSFKLAATDALQQQAKIVATRTLSRLASRVEAWPADTSRRS